MKVLGDALVDDQRRDALFKDPGATAKRYRLNKQDSQHLQKIVTKMPRDSFKALGQVVHRYVALHGFIDP